MKKWRPLARATQRPLLRVSLVMVAILALVAPLSPGDESQSRPAAGRSVDAESQPGAARMAVITIRDMGAHGMIDDIVLGSLERRVEEARAAGADTLVFELDTKGGVVTSALQICRLIKNLPDEVRTVAWVHPQAYSAGAMIALACDELWMSPSSAIGDAAPIAIVPTGGVQELGKAERAKAESPILQEFRDSAARNGYDQLLARAMVAVGDEVWWLESTRTDARQFVSGAEKKQLIDDTPADEREWKVITEYADVTTGRMIPLPQPVDGPDTLLTLSQQDAVAFGLAKGIAGDVTTLARELGVAGEPLKFQPTGWERFAAWLNSPIVRGILLVIVLIGGYIEFQSPGLILPGATALIALAIFLAAPYAAGLAGTWTLIVLALGLILLGVEIFVIPGFGIAGVIGVLLVLVGLVGTFVPHEPELPTFSPPNMERLWDGLKTGLGVLGASIAVSLAGILLLVRYLPTSRLATGVVLANPEAAALAIPEAHASIAQEGDIGVVTGDLRPGGQARFGHEVVDVQSQGEYVEAGRRVQVIRRHGMNIVVRPLPDQA